MALLALNEEAVVLVLLEQGPEVLTTKSVAPAGCELGPAPVPELQLLGAVVAGEAEALELKTVIVRIYQRGTPKNLCYGTYTRGRNSEQRPESAELLVSLPTFLLGRKIVMYPRVQKHGMPAQRPPTHATRAKTEKALRADRSRVQIVRRN